MTTSPVPRPHTTPFDRFAAWILDRGGTVYGDERERLVWYEGATIAVSVQWILLPWVLAAWAWLGDPAHVNVLGTVLLAFLLPSALCVVYINRHRVRTGSVVWNRKALTVTSLTVAPYFLFLAGVVRSNAGALRGGSVWGGVVGGAAGFAVVAVMVGLARLQRKRRERRVEVSD